LQSSNGRRAWELIDDNPDIHLVITDLVMPEMDGRELLTVLRADSRFETLPILVVSAYAGVREVAGLLELGADAFLSKPLDLDQITEYLERNIGKARTAA
jgi:two-component system chemotaxis response regulator CheY